MDEKPTNDIPEIKRMVEVRKEKANYRRHENTGAPEKKVLYNEAEMPDIRDLVMKNESFSGDAFAALNKGTRICVDGEWHTRDITGRHVHYEKDRTGVTLSDVERKLVPWFLEKDFQLSVEINEKISAGTDDISSLQKRQKDIRREIRRIRTDRGRENVLRMAAYNPKNCLAVSPDDLDRDKGLCGVLNGVLEVSGGKSGFRQVKEDDLITRFCNVPFLGWSQKCERFKSFLLEITGRQSTVDYLQRFGGSLLTGYIKDAIMLILYGPQGRNGKGVLSELWLWVLGGYATIVPSELIIDTGRQANPNSATPAEMSLYKIRAAFMSELRTGPKIDHAKAKSLTGDQRLTARGLFQKEQKVFEASHKLILLSNDLPGIEAEDSALWERLHIVEFPYSFVDRPKGEFERKKDPDLSDILKEEGPGILLWLLEGCDEWHRRGLDPPAEVLKNVLDYRSAQDPVGDFLDTQCHISPDSWVWASELFTAFEGWFIENVSKNPMKQNKFGRLLAKRGIKKEKDGKYRYLGIGLKGL